MILGPESGTMYLNAGNGTVGPFHPRLPSTHACDKPLPVGSKVASALPNSILLGGHVNKTGGKGGSPPALRHYTALCTSPLIDKVSNQKDEGMRGLWAWVEYHAMMGVDHVYVYAVDVHFTGKNAQLLRHYQMRGLVRPASHPPHWPSAMRVRSACEVWHAGVRYEYDGAWLKCWLGLTRVEQVVSVLRAPEGHAREVV